MATQRDESNWTSQQGAERSPKVVNFKLYFQLQKDYSLYHSSHNPTYTHISFHLLKITGYDPFFDFI